MIPLQYSLQVLNAASWYSSYGHGDVLIKAVQLLQSLHDQHVAVHVQVEHEISPFQDPLQYLLIGKIEKCATIMQTEASSLKKV
jgi:hypothetical protein